MAGHNKWSKIKRQKGVNDAKRGAILRVSVIKSLSRLDLEQILI